MAQIKKRPTFARSNEFGAAIKKIRTDYFENGNQKLKETGDWRLWHKAIILLTLLIAVYTVLVFLKYETWVGVTLCLLLGLTAAAIGFNVGHDANHGSFSKDPRKDKESKKTGDSLVNIITKHSFNVLGVTSSFWRTKHNLLHHTYTNLDGIDDDIAQNGLLRFHPSQPWKWIYRLQPIYCWFMYCLLYIGWVWVSDFIKYFSRKISEFKIEITKEDHFVFWATKIFHFVVFCIIPIMFVGFRSWLAGYLIYTFSVGFVISIVFQLAHIVEKVSQPEILTATEEEWIVHEVATTANFAMDNKVLSWFVGGLNFQIEHHLFPRVSHIHYPALSEKVQSVCRNYGVRYHKYFTFWSAVVSHYRTMAKLSKKPITRLT
jgi:linoleoyl-CoA desaturase